MEIFTDEFTEKMREELRQIAIDRKLEKHTEQKHTDRQILGHWVIKEEDNLKRIFQCSCSICNKDAHGYWWIYGLPKYCPNCGAIMGTDKKDWLNKDVTDWEEFETNVCYASVGYNAEISFVEKCIGRKLTYIEKYLLLKAINTKP